MKKTAAYLPFINIIAFAAVIVVNFLSNSLPLNGRTPEQISNSLPSAFTPAPYTFSIWGLIYLALTGFIIYQVLPAQRERPFQQQIGWWFVASGVANIGWIFSWHYSFYALSILFMAAILVSLSVIYTRLQIGCSGQAANWREWLFVHLPFSLYLGWITVATIANVASVAPALGWDGFGIAPAVWAAMMMGAAVVIAGLLLWNRRDFAYAGVLVWALFGIRAAQADEPLVANTAVIAAALIVILAVVGYARTHRQNGTVAPKMA
ncbi:MAG: hypothetical protein Kow0080_33510 [Candidatus Promineifilaceae bacterium]